jgi:hypothetical protein
MSIRRWPCKDKDIERKPCDEEGRDGRNAKQRLQVNHKKHRKGKDLLQVSE